METRIQKLRIILTAHFVSFKNVSGEQMTGSFRRAILFFNY